MVELKVGTKCIGYYNQAFVKAQAETRKSIEWNTLQNERKATENNDEKNRLTKEMTLLEKQMKYQHEEFNRAINELIKCECNGVKTGNPVDELTSGDVFDIVQAQVIQEKSLSEVKRVVRQHGDVVSDARIESAYKDAKSIHDRMKFHHPEF